MLTLIPIPTPLITSKDNLFEVILNSLKKAKQKMLEGDILIITSKIVSVTEGSLVKKSDLIPSEAAKEYAKQTELSPEFMELSIRESSDIYGACKGALLTKRDNTILPNAGADQSNAPEGYFITLPKNSTKTAGDIRQFLQKHFKCKIGVIIGDSRVMPMRRGTSGIALGVAGFVPVIDDRGKKDLFGRVMRITRRALADNLMCAAEIVIGEVAEKIPLVLVRGAPITFAEGDLTDTMTIPAEECMYFSTFLPKAKK